MNPSNLVNKRFTIETLTKISGVNKKTKKDWYGIASEMLRLSPNSWSNGRCNHHMIQDGINALSNGIFSEGGQGKGKADCYFQGGRVETKAYNSKDKETRVSASRFFGSNSGTAEYKKLLEEDSQKAKELLFKHSYDGNDYYLLTRTSKLQDHLKDVELIFIEKEKFIKCLTDVGTHAIMEKLYEQVEALEV
tara:strand:- start:34 stop:609 length:576 start_codon:yes stop_codon:yes gene_type:complete